MDNFTAEMFAELEAYNARMETETEPDYIPGYDDGECPEENETADCEG